MTENDRGDPIRRLEQLLDQEREALVAGQLGHLSVLLDCKQALIDRIGVLDALDRDSLDRIRDKVSRNQELLNSALDGIRAVAARIAEMRRARQSLETYDRTGRKTCIETTDLRKIERRA